MLAAYLFRFAAHLALLNGPRVWASADAIATEISETSATPEEGLQLVEIAWAESNFNRRAVGRHGERGAWQIMPPAKSYGAKEALRRLRTQGLQSYCGCVRPCPKTMAYHSERSKLWRWAFDPPETEPVERVREEGDDRLALLLSPF